MGGTELLREQVKQYIDNADELSLRRIQAILEIDQSTGWWQNAGFVSELENRYEAISNGTDKGLSIDELKMAITNQKKSAMEENRVIFNAIFSSKAAKELIDAYNWYEDQQKALVQIS